MFTTVASASRRLEIEIANTMKIFEAIPETAKNQPVADGHRTLIRLAWHIVTTIPEMMNRAGLGVSSVEWEAPVPESMVAVTEAYGTVTAEMMESLTANWTDETLSVVDDMYGEKWARGETLLVLILHEVHHRAQMTVLMRQAGVIVPGIYGPSKEEWINYGAPVPEI